MWFGAALFFSAMVAPGAFAVVRSYQINNANEVAGAIVNRGLTAINISGFVVALICLAAGLLSSRRGALKLFILEMASLSVLAIATAVGHWWIAANMHALRLTLTTSIDQIPIADPRRIRFDTLHAYSVKALSVAMIAAIAGFVIIAYRARRNAL